MIRLYFSGGTILLLPFLREAYYLPMQDALGLPKTELGVLMSALGVSSMIFYFPGGLPSDQDPPGKLITFSMFSTGLFGLYFNSSPS
ncbi:MAG TPA: hypothetical protein VMY18_11110 [Acidobacteriota bacterium]|nr:hypothetical protein [Acidobacteriota bacterium]